jgi:hypothetical protein
MKQICSFLAIATISLATLSSCAQDKSTRPSPPAKVSATTSKGVTISIDYSQPSVKGRTIGKEIAPFGQLWRTGANEATVFEVNKDVTVGGKKLPAGKYSLFSIPSEKEWTFILNKKSDLWGTDGYNETEDAARVVAQPAKSPQFTEKMTFAVNEAGAVSLLWGDVQVGFNVD